MSTLLSREARKELLTAQIDELQERGHFQDVVISGGGYSAAGLRRFLETAAVSCFDEIQQQLNEMEDAGMARERREQKWAVDDAARQKPFDPEEPTAVYARQLMEESNRAAKYAASTEGKLDKLIALNERIATALEKRG